VLAAWWRQQDQHAATPLNERLAEHLTRVAEARRLYMHEDYIDARGRVYIRLGAPPITQEVSFADYPVMQREIIRTRPNISSFDFSPGIYWEYDELGTEAHFLFLESEEGTAYELGTVTDMIPRNIRRNFTGRSENTYAYLRSMEVALRQLSIYNPRYMGRYAEVENYIAYYKTGGGINFEGPAQQATRVNQQNTIEDHRLKRERRESIGASQTNVDDNLPGMNVQTRWARFLNDDGTTRTEVYWTAQTDALDPHTAINAEGLQVDDMEVDTETMPRTSRIVANMRLEDARHRATEQASTQTQVPATLSSEWLPAQTITTEAETTPFHLGMQWDQRLGADAEDAGNILLRRATARIDTLSQLSSDPDSVEMSDVKLVHADPEALADGVNGAALPPYPLQQANEDTSLGIYFEVYHLMFNEQDRARYTIDLTADRVQPRQGIARWVRSDEQLETTTTTTNETTQRQTRELFLLDMSTWQNAASEEDVTLTVRVTDEVSGASVERDVTLSILREDM
jgi:GWxTD domain-containing protein